MLRQSIPETEARRLLNGGIVTLVTTAWRGAENVAPVIWHMPLSVEPPLLGIALHPARHTHDMIRFSQQFVLNIPTAKLLKHVHYTGLVSGADIGKIEAAYLRKIKARKVQAPLLDNCVGWIECGLEDSLRFGDHTLFVGRVAAVSIDAEAFDGVWKLDDPDLRPLHYLGGHFYATLGERIEAELEREEPEPDEKEGAYAPPREERG